MTTKHQSSPPWLLAFFVISGPVIAASPADELFEKTVQPIFAEQCYKCHSHSADKIKGGLVLDSLSGLLKGGDSGPAITPGKVEESLLIKAIRYTDPDLQMPPKGKKLSADQIAALEKWVQAGAPWPGTDKAKVKVRGKITDEDRAWWAFQPVRRPNVPEINDEGWSRNTVDRFIFKKLQEAGLRPSPETDRRTLIRRVYYDLVGLPPSAEEIQTFALDSAPRAYERLVERLLESPRYGERWARFWLDLGRYAESDGYKADSYRPHAWRYRDYVIKSLNDDKPYDQFVREQLAGDELAPNDPDAVVATTFLRNGIYEYNNVDARGQWDSILNELTDVTGDVFMGLGMSCARCHDHKYDPILQKDYYRLQAFFAPIALRDDISIPGTPVETKAYREQLAAWQTKTEELRSEIDCIEEDYRTQNERKAAAKFPEDIQDLIAKPAAERTPYEEQIVQLAYRQVTPAFEQLETKLKGDLKARWLELQKKMAEFDALKPKPFPEAFVATDVGPLAPATYIPKARTKEPVLPGYLTLFGEQPAEISTLPTAPNSTGRRAALAKWLTRPENPLTSRVIVNRIWQQHFGRGLVATTSDFGKLGQTPSHPELLDWLATELVAKRWSLKEVHRLILTSAAYRQSALDAGSKIAAKTDPENTLLWRMNVRRLDGDQIRDSILFASGQLDLEMGGPSVDGTKPRRTIYTKVRRNTHDPLLEAFDAPDNISSTPKRNVTVTPTQALLMLNSQSLVQRSKALAERIEKSQPPDDGALITAIYQNVLGREPDSWERSELVQFLHDQTERIIRGLARPKPISFWSDVIPGRDGKAALLDIAGEQHSFEIPDAPAFHKGDFTIEAIVVAKALADETIVSTVAAHWSGSKTQPGWSLGITGRKWSGKPQRLVLQMSGTAAQGGKHEAISSDFQLDLNKPYYVAAAVQFGVGTSRATLYAKNLADDEEPLHVFEADHQMPSHSAPKLPVTIGSVSSEGPGYQFQGLIDQVRFSQKALAQDQLLIKIEESRPDTVGYWHLKTEKDYYRDHTGNGHDIQRKMETEPPAPRRAAVQDVCHALLNCNEFFYID